MKKDRLNFLNSVQASTPLQGLKPGKLNLIPVQVLEVILNHQNPDFIGAVKYKPLDGRNDRNSTENAPLAFPLRSHIRQLPLVDEIVLLVQAPGKGLRDSLNSRATYYTDVVNIWNHPQNGCCPLANKLSEPTQDFLEKPDLNPLYPFDGDVILEGRSGQSVRLSQSIPGKTPWIGELGDPIMIFSNGQVETSNGFSHILEDINEDFSSLYLSSKQSLPIKPKNTLTSPLDTYKGAQAVLTGDRLVLNAKQDNIYLTTPGLIEITSETTRIQSKSNVSIQTTRINLGKDANQRVILGDSFLAELSAVLQEVQKLALAVSPLGALYPAVIEASAQTVLKVTEFQTKLDSFKSTTTFTR